MRPMTKTTCALVSVLAALACNPNDALKPPDPGVVTTIGAAALPGIYAGSISDFQLAWSGAGDVSNGGHEGHIGLSSIFTDEMTAAGLDIFTFRIQLDQRAATPSNTQLYGIFNDMSAARVSTELAATRFAQFAPTDIGHAEVENLSAYAYVQFAEDWCSGVPFSAINTKTGQLTYGVPLTTAQILARALQKFDSASTLATLNDTASSPVGQSNSTEQLALSQLGRARVLLDMGQFDAAGAAADSALLTDPSLAYLIENSTNTPRQYNGMWEYSEALDAFGVPNGKDGNGLQWRSASDPRVLWLDSHHLGSEFVDTIWYQMKYQQKFASATLGSATEATLISAERDLHDGNVPSWAAKLNALRAGAGLTDTVRDSTGTPVVDNTGHIETFPMPPLSADSTTLASDSMRVEVHFRERAFWLWLTGERLADLRRLVRQYGHNDFPNVSPAVNPNPDVRFSVPVQEQNNPNFHQCLDAGHEQP